MRATLAGLCLLAVSACGKPKPKPVRYHRGHVGPQDVLSEHAHLEVLGQNAELVEYTRAQLKGAQLTWVFDTPCGAKRSAPLPLPALTDVQTDVFVDAPDTLELPLVTTVLVDPQLTKKITIGSVVIDPKATQPTDLVDISCTPTFKVGDTDVEMPKVTKGMGDHTKYAIFVTDRPDECFVQYYVTYIKKGRNTTPMNVPPRMLQGARAYEVWGNFAYWFQPVPDEIKMAVDSSQQLRSGFDLCSAYLASP